MPEMEGAERLAALPAWVRELATEAANAGVANWWPQDVTEEWVGRLALAAAAAGDRPLVHRLSLIRRGLAVVGARAIVIEALVPRRAGSGRPAAAPAGPGGCRRLEHRFRVPGRPQGQKRKTCGARAAGSARRARGEPAR